MIGVLAHRQTLALDHHVADVAEHKEIAGDGAGEAGDIVGIAGDEADGKTFCVMRCRTLFRDGVGDALCEFVAERDVVSAGEFGKTVGKVDVAGRQRRLDILADDVSVIPQCRTELQFGQICRIVLRRQDGTGLAGMRPQQRARYGKRRQAESCQTDPRPLHPEKAQSSRCSLHGMSFLGHNSPDERRASPGRQDCVEFA